MHFKLIQFHYNGGILSSGIVAEKVKHFFHVDERDRCYCLETLNESLPVSTT